MSDDTAGIYAAVARLMARGENDLPEGWQGWWAGFGADHRAYCIACYARASVPGEVIHAHDCPAMEVEAEMRAAGWLAQGDGPAENRTGKEGT